MDPIILAIDTSCDETAAAVVWGRRILSNVISSQVDIHQKYGGVYPVLAKRAHIEKIDGVVNEALKRASVAYKKIARNKNNSDNSIIQVIDNQSTKLEYRNPKEYPISNIQYPKHNADHRPPITDHYPPLSAVAVTQGPGLAIALEVGIAKAIALATSTKLQASNPKQIQNTNDQNIKHNESYCIDSRFRGNDRKKQQATINANLMTTNNGLPLIAVNHLEGHILSTIAQNSAGNPKREIIFPALALVVSGGNTQMLLVHDIGKYELISETLDDACGEALDKAARILKLGYPGGPIIERLALTGDPTKYVLKPALTAKNNLYFSYSGLKTAFLYLVNSLPEKEFGANLSNLAASFQYWAFEQIIRKLSIAIEVYQPKSILCGGGVIANKYLRNLIYRSITKFDVPLYFPTSKLLYGDNAAMIGVAAYYKYLRGEFVKLEELDRKPRLPL